MTILRRLAAPVAITFSLCAAPAAGALAQTLCSAPIAPFCVEVAATYDDAGTSDRCSQDLETFAAQVDDYTACLEQQVEELRAEQAALEESFRCQAEGGADCPQDSDTLQ